MVHREPRDDDREGAIGVGQVRDVALLEADIGEALFVGQQTGPFEHCRRHVDAGRVLHMRRETAHDDAAAAGDIEHGVVGGCRGGFDDQPQGAGVGDRRGGAERRRLPGKLVADQFAVRGVAHAQAASSRVEPTSSVVARRRSRGKLSSCGRPRCIVSRLSQMTRSPSCH